jgi:hypothetical protein
MTIEIRDDRAAGATEVYDLAALEQRIEHRINERHHLATVFDALAEHRNKHRAKRLFFLLRCTITRDPRHLPTELLKVTNAVGKTIIAGTREAAEAHRGEPFTFEEIHAHQQSRNVTGERLDPTGAYSHAYTAIGNTFA